jgi:predicted ATPase
MQWATLVRSLYREVPAVQAQAEALFAFSTAHGFPAYVGFATLWRGWVLALQGKDKAGLPHIYEGLAAALATGNELARPFFLVKLAEAAGHAGEVEEGQRALAEALPELEAKGQGYLLAEAYRLQGTFLLRQADAVGAEASFQRAIDVARRQHAKSWELRAGMSLGRLWEQQGKRTEARNLLTEIYGWFTEGFETADLHEAQVLLEEWGA